MSPSTEPEPAHDSGGDRRGDGPPTIAELAALTRRLRELSARGRHADPAERVAFIAEKEALLARLAEPGLAAERVCGGREADIDDDGDAAGWSR